jgi:hypothetical protein
MIRPTAPSRCRPIHPSRFRAPGAENQVALGLLGLPPALGAGRSGTVRPGEAPKEAQERVRRRPGGGRMPSDGPTAEPGQVIWEMSGKMPSGHAVACDDSMSRHCDG